MSIADSQQSAVAIFGSDITGVSCAVRLADGRLRVSAKGPRAAARLRERLGAGAGVRVVARDRLDAAPSLAHLLAELGEGDIVHDPSGVATRARAATRFVAEMRGALGRGLRLALFDGARRRVVLVLAKPRRAELDAVNSILRDAQTAFAERRDELRAHDFAPDVLLTFALPPGGFVPIDRASARGLRFRRGWRRLLGLGIASAGATAMAAAPAQGQTVGQISGQGGVASDEEAFGGEGVFAINGEAIGFQLDAGVNRIDGDTAGQLGGHLFHRMDSGLIGLTGRWNDLGPVDRWQVGVEAEHYIDRVTLTGEVGYEDTDFRDGDIYAVGGVGFYPSDHASIYVVGGYTLGEGVVQASFEIQPAAGALPGLSLFADGGLGVSGDGFVAAGLRFTFGSRSSLIDRDRREIIRRRLNPLALAPDSSS